MAVDPLATLIKLRRNAQDDAARRLSSALTAVDRAERAVQEVKQTIQDETDAASDPSGTDAMVEAFAAWLPQARQALAAAQRHATEMNDQATRARAELTACRTALESVEELQKQRREEAAHARELAERREIEDRPPRLPDDDDQGKAA